MVQEIALDLSEKERLEATEKINLLQLASYKSLVHQLETTGQHKSLQLELLQKQNRLLDSQLKMEKANIPKAQTFLWLLRLLGVFATGYLLGSI